jgi:membrane-associated phospholipid phosphatase
LILAGLVGTARVLAGVHHSVDIIGSLVISAGVSFLVYKFILPKISESKIYKNYFN